MQTDRLLVGSGGVFDGVDADALASMGIDLDVVREAVERNFGLALVCSPWARRWRVWLPGYLPVTGRARSCLWAAVGEAGRGGGAQVATHHLGAVVVGAGGGVVPPILVALGVSAPVLRTAILDVAR